jgi:hypothetical protein
MRRFATFALSLAIVGATRAGLAQHEAHDMGGMSMHPSDSEHASHGASPTPAAMDMSDPIGVPHTREASGTSWQPDATPMRAIHAKVGGFTFMFHENVFVGFDAQSSDRGGHLFDSVNWVMGMVRRRVGRFDLGARVMLSAEPWTIGGQGYPLLLQTGESFRGAPLHDRQHPHDLFMELALLSNVALSEDVALQAYVAPAGEPALGPTAFPHRASARFDPLATIGHHWQDSTHISFGVATLGVYTRLFKLEGSWFNGREPDERRYDLDLRTPDSFSGRLSVNPTEALSMQVSYGWLKSPEALEPEQSLNRATGSVSLAGPAFSSGGYAVTGALGINVPSEGPTTQSSLLEGTLDVTAHHAVFGRVELATKTGADLARTSDLAEERYRMAVFALGYAYSLSPLSAFVPSLGVRGALNVVDERLRDLYGTRTPVGGMIYLKVEVEPMPRHHAR